MARPGRPSAAFCGVLLLPGTSGCLRPNPDFNPGASATGTSAGSTEAVSTTKATSATATSATATSGSEGGASMSQDSESASAGTNTTGPPDPSSSTTSGACAQVGESCASVGCCADGCTTCQAGLCVSSCATCQACAAGQCVVAEGALCTLEIGERCEDFIAGPSEIGCRVYAPAPGLCSAAGACSRQCESAGGFAPGGKCDVRCAHDEACVPDTPAVDFVPDAYCTFNAMTPMCQPTCTENGIGAQVIDYACDWMGQCLPTGSHECGFYACNQNDTACLTQCFDSSDCILAMCAGMVCTG